MAAVGMEATVYSICMEDMSLGMLGDIFREQRRTQGEAGPLSLVLLPPNCLAGTELMLLCLAWFVAVSQGALTGASAAAL